jgi:hypothetical protein
MLRSSSSSRGVGAVVCGGGGRRRRERKKRRERERELSPSPPSSLHAHPLFRSHHSPPYRRSATIAHNSLVLFIIENTKPCP